MTRKEAERQTRQADMLRALGFTNEEAESLRRISMTLQRWYERECGDSNAYGSWAIERDDNGDGPPYLVHHHYQHGKGPDYTTRIRIADRERGAVRRLATIIAARNTRQADDRDGICGCGARVGHIEQCERGAVSYYLQTDPRGAALYIIRPGDVPDGKDVSSYYDRGICVY